MLTRYTQTMKRYTQTMMRYTQTIMRYINILRLTALLVLLPAERLKRIIRLF